MFGTKGSLTKGGKLHKTTVQCGPELGLCYRMHCFMTSPSTAVKSRETSFLADFHLNNCFARHKKSFWCDSALFFTAWFLVQTESQTVLREKKSCRLSFRKKVEKSKIGRHVVSNLVLWSKQFKDKYIHSHVRNQTWFVPWRLQQCLS